MLDIKLLRDQRDLVKERLRIRNADPALIDGVLDADARWRAVTAEAEALQAQLKRDSNLIGPLMRDGKQEEAKAVKAKNREIGDRVAFLNTEVRGAGS